MKDKSAFPYHRTGVYSNGMTLKQYACIKLKIPKTGDEELDNLIKESLRNDFAAKVLQELLAAKLPTEIDNKTLVKLAYIMADEMLKANEDT